MSEIDLLEKTKTVNLAEVDELVSLLRGRVIVKKFEVLPSRELFSRNGGGLLVSLKQLNSNTAEIGFSRRRHEQIIRVRVRKPASLGLLCKTLRKLLQSYILSNLIKEINRATMLSGSKKIEHYDWITHHLLIAKKAGQDIENVCEHISKLYNISERDQKLIRSFWLPLHAQEAVCRDDVDWFFDTPEIREALGQLVDDSVIEEFFSQSVKINQIIALKQERVDEPEERKEETMIPDNIPETVPESVREFWPALVDEGIFHEQGVVVTSYSGFLIRKFGTKKGQAYVARLRQHGMVRRLNKEEIVWSSKRKHVCQSHTQGSF